METCGISRGVWNRAVFTRLLAAACVLALAGCEDGFLAGLFSGQNEGESKKDWGGVNAPAIINPASLSVKEKFGITASGPQAVTETFNTLHAFIQAGGLNLDPPVIRPGDYIDLAGLEIQPYNGAGDTLEINSPIERELDSLPFTGYEGYLLRLVVAGVNSFQTRAGYEYAPPPGSDHNATPHVVFHFQNTPASYYMRTPDDRSEEGYEGSDMRRYLVPVDGAEGSGVFLRGLIDAGVPEEILWAPTRFVTENGMHAYTNNWDEKNDYYLGKYGKGLHPLAQKAQTIRDKLWLPTYYEMNAGAGISDNYKSLGTVGYPNGAYETPENQAKLDYYYEGDNKLVKHGSDSEVSRYWLASPSNDQIFCWVHLYDGPGPQGLESGHTHSFGVAPAFCVK